MAQHTTAERQLCQCNAPSSAYRSKSVPRGTPAQCVCPCRSPLPVCRPACQPVSLSVTLLTHCTPLPHHRRPASAAVQCKSLAERVTARQRVVATHSMHVLSSHKQNSSSVCTHGQLQPQPEPDPPTVLYVHAATRQGTNCTQPAGLARITHTTNCMQHGDTRQVTWSRVLCCPWCRTHTVHTKHHQAPGLA